MSDVSIRPVEQSERETWNELFQGYADFYHVPIDDDIQAAVWAWIFDDDNDFWCDVAVDSDGQIIGLTTPDLTGPAGPTGLMPPVRADDYHIPGTR